MVAKKESVRNKANIFVNSVIFFSRDALNILLTVVFTSRAIKIIW